MARVFITGSTDGIGLAAARTLLEAGHEVVLHARTKERAADVADLAARCAGVAVGDLSSAADTRAVADQVNALGRMDAVIHNAGTYLQRSRGATPEGHAVTFAVNTLAPYILTALMHRPKRLIYLSSGMHLSGHAQWTDRPSYSDTKLYVLMLAKALARKWPEVKANAVDPGWVPTKMGGKGAPDDLQKGYETQVWLATSNDPVALVSGQYFHHQRPGRYNPAADEVNAQDQLLAECARLTGIAL